MSASIHALLADELDIPTQKAEKLLSAMLREVRKRAERGGVRLPDLGKFKVEDDELTFYPADSLARAVNHRFEGLESENLRGAPEPDAGEDKDTEGPSTITLGYQDSSGWTPLDADDSSADTEGEEAGGTDEEEEPDTEEFELPAADPDSAAGADDASASPEETGEPAPSSDTEELYPLVDEATDESVPDAPSSTPAASPTADADPPEPGSETEIEDGERDELSEIWESVPDEAPSDPSADAEVDDNTDAGDSSLEDTAGETDAPAAEPEETTVPDEDPEGEPETTSASESSAPNEPASERGSSLPRVLVTLLVLLLLGGGAWYILGQRGMVPPPGQTLFQGTGSSAPNQTTSSAEQQAAGPSGTSAAGTSEQDASSSSEASADASDSSAASPGAAAAPSIDPASGGWTIVVASRADRDAAASLVDTFQQRFQNSTQPVDVLQGTVDNATRYRVGVGQFSSRGAAEAFLEDNGDALPNGAWTLALE